MADIKISQLGAAIAVNDSDLLPIVSNGSTLKAPASLVKEYAVGDTDLTGIGDGTPTGAISALNTAKQPKTLDTPLTIGGEQKTTVEAALGGLNSESQSLSSALTNVENVLGAKNLLPNNGTNASNGNVTYEVQSDGRVIATTTGTRTTNSWFEIATIYLDAGSYILSGCPSGGGENSYLIGVNFNDSSVMYYDSGSDYQFTLNSRTKVLVRIRYSLNYTTLDSKTFSPMIRLVGTDSTFVPYAMTNKGLTENLQSIGSIVSLISGAYGQTQFDIPSQYRNNKYQFEVIVTVLVDDIERRLSLNVAGDGVTSPLSKVVFILGGYATAQYNCYAEIDVLNTGKAYLNSVFVNGTSYINAAQTYAVMRKIAL